MANKYKILIFSDGKQMLQINLKLLVPFEDTMKFVTRFRGIFSRIFGVPENQIALSMVFTPVDFWKNFNMKDFPTPHPTEEQTEECEKRGKVICPCCGKCRKNYAYGECKKCYLSLTEIDSETIRG